MFRLVVWAAVVSVTTARRSANADTVDNILLLSGKSQYPATVVEDALLDAPGLIKKYGYPCEVHTVVTEDGYILEVHRIPHGKGGEPGPRRVVIITHGLLSSSSDFLILGPTIALAYLLADAGYDVWLVNCRGNYYSRHHTTLNPDALFNNDFWKFSWDEMGNYDLPACIDYILAKTGEKKLHYVGHSQGGTTFLVMIVLRPEYCGKIISFQGLAPATFFDNNESILFNSLSIFEKLIEKLFFATDAEVYGKSWFRLDDFLGVSTAADLSFTAVTHLSTREYYNQTMKLAIIGQGPAGASIRQFAHFGQVIKYHDFSRYNYNPLKNVAVYGSTTPPAYNLSLVNVPSYLYYGMSDEEVNYKDLLKLASILPHVVEVHKAKRDSFNHFDFMWGRDVKELIYDDVLASMKDAEEKSL